MEDQRATKCGAVCTTLAHTGVHSRSLPAIVALLMGLAASVFGAAGPTATTFQAIDLNPAALIESWASGAGANQQVGYGCYVAPSSTAVHALLWTGSADSAIDLHPPWGPFQFSWSGAGATDGEQQVGWGNVYFAVGGRHPQIVNYYHALLWTGSAASAVDLHPAGFSDSWAYGVGGGQQVGYGLIYYYSNKKGGSSIEQTHALLWAGSAASAVDLNPAGFTDSRAFGVSSGQQVGSGHSHRFVNRKLGYLDQWHALLWTGSAASAVDLHPAGFTSSWGLGAGGGQQVGYGVLADGTHHALVWHGTAASVVDLHPAGFTSSSAKAASNGRQVGRGTLPDGTEHALLWKGGSAGVTDLHAFLPTWFTNSVATGIDVAGNIVGYAYNTPPNPNQRNNHAFLWQPK